MPCYSRLTLWTHFTLERKKRSKRGIKACGAGRSLQVYPVIGHEGSLLDHSKSFPGGLLWDWKSDVRACERWTGFFFHGKGRKGEGYPEWVICYLREKVHILVSQITIQNGQRGSCFSVACVPVTLQAAGENCFLFYLRF